MKRRIIRLGASTQVVSLPKRWTTRYGLKAGDELDVEERGRQLSIATGKDLSLEKSSVDITNLVPLHNFGIAGLYLRGLDEVEVKSEKPELIARLSEHPVSQLVGFEVVEQAKNRALLKDVSGTKEIDISGILRRIFLLVLSLHEEMLKAAKAKETKLDHILSIDLNVNRFCFLCLRLLNKRGAPDYRHTPVLYYLVTQLEGIGDEYKRLAYYLMQNRQKLDDKSIALFAKVGQMLRDYYELFFKFDPVNAAGLEARYRKLITEFESAMSKARQGQLRALVFVENVSDRIAEMLRNQLVISL